MLTFPFFEWYYESFLELPGKVIVWGLVILIAACVCFGKGSAIVAVFGILLTPLALYLFLVFMKELQPIPIIGWVAVLLRLTVDLGVIMMIVIPVWLLFEKLWNR